MDELFQDLRQTLRWIRKRPGLTAAIVLSLAVGVGANTAIFSLANMLLIRPLPFPEEHELLRLRSVVSQEGQEPRRVEINDFSIVTLREQATTLEEVAGWVYRGYNLVGTDTDVPVQVWGSMSSAGALQVMGVQPILGRFILPEEDAPNAAANVVVISHVLWQNRFGGDPEILGRTIKIDEELYEVIGVMPPLFEYPYKSKLWIPLGLGSERSRRGDWVHSVVRLKDGTSREQAQEELGVIAARLAQDHPDAYDGWSFDLTPVREDLTSDLHPKKVVYLLLAGAFFLLLIACVNVANVLLGRSLEQSGEIALRVALGSGRARIVRQLVTQGLTLALFGGALGLLLAWWTVGPLAALHPADDLNILFLDIKIDHRVLAFTLLISIAVGVAFSLVPALKTSRPNLQAMLMEGSRTTTSRAGIRLLRLLVVVEVAVAVMLLVGSTLMVRSLQRLYHIEPGFNVENMLLLRITPSASRYPDFPRQVAYYAEVLERIRAIPEVVEAGMTSLYPNRIMVILVGALPEGRPENDPDEVLQTNHRVISPGVMEAMKMRLVEGRFFTEQDRWGSEWVVIVSETLARNAWPDQNALDRRVRMLVPGMTSLPWMRVVGVVGDVFENGDYENTWYVSYRQVPPPAEYVDIVVRTRNQPMAVLPAVRETIWAVDDEQPVALVTTAKELLFSQYWRERTSTFLMVLFAAVGLVLTIVGIYGIQSYSVVQKTHEMGVHMVLGARPRDIVLKVLRDGMLVAAVGLAVGLLGAFWLTRFLSAVLHGISPTDPATYTVAAVITLVVALLANYLPARRATRADPAGLLRY
ncbi:MAG: ABC transporter permease [bacterium]|nr:ABC transporter permease [bacterium]